MSAATAGSSHRMTLEGEWVLETADQQIKDLAERLAKLLHCEPRPCQVEVDLAGIAEIDACGCQMLALFLAHLTRHGVTPLPCGSSTDVKDKLVLLGFSGVLNGAVSTEEGAP